MQEQVQQPRKQRQRRRWSRGQLLTVVIVILALPISVVWIVSSVGIISGAWASALSIIVVVSGVVATVLPLISSAGKSTNLPLSTVPRDDISVSSAGESSLSANKTAYRGIVDRPPPADPRTIQQREKAVTDIYSMLSQSEVTAVVLIGIGGVGKSTLAGLVYHYAERQRSAGAGPFTAQAIWIRIDPAVTMSDLIGTLMEAIGKAMPDLSHLSPQNQAVVLLEAMNDVDKARLVILDQFENLLDVRTGRALPDRPGIGEWLDVINSQKCTCRILLTSRLLPQGTRKYPLTFMQAYHVAGLTGAEGTELLQKQGVKATGAKLKAAVTRCAGHAFSLTLLASLLHTHKLSLGSLLGGPAYAQLWTGDIAQNFLDAIYSQLNDVQHKVLFAFSIYREPVPLEAARVVIGDTSEISKSQVASAIHALLVQHLLQATGEGLYQLHVIVATYVQEHIVEDDEPIGQEALRTAHGRAAQYYLRQAAVNCPPKERAKEYLEQALSIVEKEESTRGKGTTLNNLGKVCAELGETEQAREYLEQSLVIRREKGYRAGEGKTLRNLGSVYKALDQIKQAQKCYQDSLNIFRGLGDREEEGATLYEIGMLYFEQEFYDNALAYFLLARNRFEEVQTPHQDVIEKQLGILRIKMGKKRFDASLASIKPDALRIVEQVLHKEK